MEIVNYTFKEICNKTGYTASAIRYYEKEFMISIPRDANGRRLFTKIEFDLLLFIKELQKQHFTNGEIKKILKNKTVNVDTKLANDEVALTKEFSNKVALSTDINPLFEDNIIHFIDEKFNEINNNIIELNQNISSKERDILISENMKLKMEIKRKSYEVIELKENLRFFKEKNLGFLKKLFKKKN
jgi:DNA-binding transcriptional MerR regulator